MSAAIALVVCVTAEFFVGTGIGAYMLAQQAAYRLPQLYAAAASPDSSGVAIDATLRSGERRALFWVGEERARTGERARCRTPRRRPPRCAGVRCGARDLGGVGAQRELFFLPPASDVALRAWDVWPSAGFLSAVGASLKRLSAGYAIGAAAALRSAWPWDPRLG